MHEEKIYRLSRRFNGPPTTGNGGYTAGFLADKAVSMPLLGQALHVELKAPPPLDTVLTLEKVGEQPQVCARLLQDGREIAVLTQAASFDPLPDGLTDCEAVAGAFAAEAVQSFGGCFVCGRDRVWPDGLCLHAVQVKDGAGHIRPGFVRADWKLHPDFVRRGVRNGDSRQAGEIDTPLLWAALDCPGYYACAAGLPALLGRMSFIQHRPLLSDEEGVRVIGWDKTGDAHTGGAAEAGKKGRTRRCGTALVSGAGEVIAQSEAVWVLVSEAYIASLMAQ